jgi:hypothetical protein
MKQRKLNDDQIERLRAAKDAVINMNWTLTSEGPDFWEDVYSRIRNKAHHGTTDGKPWVEPELTDEDAKQRKLIMCRQSDAYLWGGPFILIRVTPGVLSYIAEHNPQHVCFYKHARLATPEEIEAANANRQ